MENMNTLNDLFKDIADSIREKKGSTDKILPKDFSNEIRNISGGGKPSISYFKYPEAYIDYFYIYGIAYGKNENAGYKGIFSYSMYNNHPIEVNPLCIGILNDGKDILAHNGVLVNKGESIYDFIKNVCEMGGVSIEEANALIATIKSLEITEEEFYKID